MTTKGGGQILSQYTHKQIHNLSLGRSWKKRYPSLHITPFLGLGDLESHLKVQMLILGDRCYTMQNVHRDIHGHHTPMVRINFQFGWINKTANYIQLDF